MMDEGIDPAENRDEFIERVDRMYDYCRLINVESFMRCVLKDDTVQMNTLSENVSAWDEAKNRSISAYDAARDVTARRVIVGSINLNGLPR